MITRSLRKEDVQKDWYIIDATDLVVGRLSSIIATYLKGKHKPSYTPHVDCGDNIVVINAKHVKFTGKKTTDRKFYWHTGFPGGIKERTMKDLLTGEFPERVLSKAVERMLPKGPLGRQMMKNLRVYPEAAHPHEAQEPKALDVAAMNSKNKRSA